MLENMIIHCRIARAQGQGQGQGLNVREGNNTQPAEFLELGMQIALGGVYSNIQGVFFNWSARFSVPK